MPVSALIHHRPVHRSSARRAGLALLVVGGLALSACGGGGGAAAAAGPGQAGGGQCADRSATAAQWPEVEAAAQKEKELLYYSTSADMADALTAGFVKAYPWASVKSVTASAGTIASRAITEAQAGSKTADVIMTPRGNQVGLVQADVVTKSQLPNDQTMTQQFVDASYRSHPIYVTPTTLTYNTDKITAAQMPKDVFELADPKYKGRIAFDRPSNGATSAGFLATQKIVMGDAKWTQWLQGLQANQIFVTNDSTSGYEALVRGEVDIVVDGPNDVLGQAKGTPAAFAVYNDMASFIQSLWITCGASSPDVAKLFVNWVISPDGQAVLAATGRTPALQTVDSPVSIKRLLPADTTFAPANALEDFYNNPKSYQDIYGKLWPNQ